MALYDQPAQNGTPWYAPQQNTYLQTQKQTPINTIPQSYQPNVQQNSSVSQFVWVNGPGVVDMWPVAAGSEMTFIDNEAMMLYVKRVDSYNHPLKTRKFKLTEIVDEEIKETSNSINVDELKTFLSGEIDRIVNDRFNSLFRSNQTYSKDGDK